MTFLKKLGAALLKITAIAVGIGPILQPLVGSGKSGALVGTAVNDLTAIGSTIVQIETAFAAVPGSTGAQKLQAAIPLVGNIVKTSELVSGKKIANETLFTQAVQEIAQGMVDLLNSIDANEVKTT
jgi:hypothetical protein